MRLIVGCSGTATRRQFFVVILALGLRAFVLCPEGATELSPGFQPWVSSTKSDAPCSPFGQALGYL